MKNNDPVCAAITGIKSFNDGLKVFLEAEKSILSTVKGLEIQALPFFVAWLDAECKDYLLCIYEDLEMFEHCSVIRDLI